MADRERNAGRIELARGDITRMEVDAIVNAANNSLLGGGGVDGAIHRAAGPQLLEACRALHGCKTGEAKITPGYKLPARWIIHTVGPVWSGGGRREAELLAACYRNSLGLAQKHQISTIAFPAISTGAYGFPLEQACSIALNEINGFLELNPLPQKIFIVCFDQRTHEAYVNAR
jgi:O-acetyl-ADP-ribose deacetylase (regulator of RNase III)